MSSENGSTNGGHELTKAELADAILVDAPQPTTEGRIALYRIYRQIGGDALTLYEDLIATSEANSPDLSSQAA